MCWNNWELERMAKPYTLLANIGHYGLGFEYYCHFTKFIRRYPDVMVHCILQECLERNLKLDKKMDEK